MSDTTPIQSISGLASGLDTASIVAKLMEIERRPQVRVQERQKAEQARQDVLRDVQTRLANLATAAAALADTSTWAPKQSITSTDPAHVDVAVAAGTPPGGYSLWVEQLACADVVVQATGSTVTAAGADETLTLAVGAGTPLDVGVKAGDSLETIAAAINTAAGAAKTPVQASVVDGKLVLAGQVTGEANRIAVSSTGTLATDLFGADPAHTARDAKATLNGVAVTSSTNVLAGAVPGLTLTLRGVIPATSPATIGIGAAAPSTDAITAKVRDFVSQYNSTVSFVQGKLNEQRPASGSSGTTGLLRGDSDLAALLRRLRDAVTSGAKSGGLTLASIGLSTTASSASGATSEAALQGHLALDADALSKQLGSSLADVQKLVTDAAGGTGLAQRLGALLTPYTKLGGLMDARLAASKSASTRLSQQSAQLDERLGLREKALRAQFSALETAMQRAGAQGSWLGSQLAQLQQQQ